MGRAVVVVELLGEREVFDFAAFNVPHRLAMGLCFGANAVRSARVRITYVDILATKDEGVDGLSDLGRQSKQR